MFNRILLATAAAAMICGAASLPGVPEATNQAQAGYRNRYHRNLNRGYYPPAYDYYPGYYPAPSYGFYQPYYGAWYGAPWSQHYVVAPGFYVDW